MTETLVSLGAVTVDGYRLRTGDRDSDDVDVSGALLDAQDRIEEELNRSLALDERTETMRLWPYGRVYPKAWPLLSCTTNTIDGRALLGAAPDVQQFLTLVDASDDVYHDPSGPTPRATITYRGGFDDGSVGTKLPRMLADALYDLAHALITDAPAMLVGAASVSVGDVSISGMTPAGSGIDAYVPGLSSRIGLYRNRQL